MENKVIFIFEVDRITYIKVYEEKNIINNKKILFVYVILEKYTFLKSIIDLL
jgi:hypothetical protein